MKRLHVHVAVQDLAQSIRFYSALFAAEPTVQKSDYAKWMLDDPCVNFAISTRSAVAGLDHLGIQVEDETELQEVYHRLKQAERPVLEQGETTCCYARSEKAWIADPQGLYWEAFYTHGEATVYGENRLSAPMNQESACCAPVLVDNAQIKTVCGSTPVSACCG